CVQGWVSRDRWPEVGMQHHPGLGKLTRALIAGAFFLASLLTSSGTGAAIVGTGLRAGDVAGASPSWTQAPSPPLGRTFSNIVYDDTLQELVMFGGLASEDGTSPYLNDTWSFDGRTWRQLFPAASPPAREAASMAYDAATQTVVLFGGSNLNDIWTFDGTTWTQQFPLVSPPIEGWASMAYDAATQTIVLFGGWLPPGSYSNQTWVWDGRAKAWTQKNVPISPPARLTAGMTYDAATASVVLFSGCGGSNCSQILNDTWTWNGSGWAQRFPATSPPGSYGTAFAYDEATYTAIAFGGVTTNSCTPNLNQTWSWDGT